jgi:multidrug resistance efflux pump
MHNATVRRLAPLTLLLVLIVAGAIYLAGISGSSDGPLRLSGTISAVEVTIAPELTGRVVEVAVSEGQVVSAGEVLFRIDAALLTAQRERAAAAVALARSALETARANAEVARVQRQQALSAAHSQELPVRLATWRQSAPWQFSLPPWYFEQEEDIAAAERALTQAEQELEAARQDLEGLLSEEQQATLGSVEERLALAVADYEVAREVYDRANLGRVTQDILNLADDQLQQAGDELDEAQQAYDDLFADETSEAILIGRAQLALAQASYDAALDRLIQLQTGEDSLQVRAAQALVIQAEAAVSQAGAAVAQAEAELATLEVQLDKLTVTAPMDAVVITHGLEPGEVAIAGGAVMTLGKLDSLTITVYAPEDRYGQIRLGEVATVSVDSFPGETFRATVSRIADQAEFTPRNVQTEEGRRTTVFAVDLQLEDPHGKLKPGMPADVRFGSD